MYRCSSGLRRLIRRSVRARNGSVIGFGTFGRFRQRSVSLADPDLHGYERDWQLRHRFGLQGLSALGETRSSVLVPQFLTAGSLAMLLRIESPSRFSLRSLFIATTFLAVVLGMIAWLDRAWIGK